MDEADLLKEGLEKLGLTLEIEPLLNYVKLLEKWNRAYNLTAVHGTEAMITRHLLDSLAIYPWVTGARILDVGSGAGLPGIPLAVANPSHEIVLIDSNGKKVRFMEEAKRLLKLNNVHIIQQRVEDYCPQVLFSTIMSRAFTNLEQMVNWTKHLLQVGGLWLSMKGHYPEEELQSIKLPFKVEKYHVPGLESQRCCVIIRNTAL